MGYCITQEDANIFIAKENHEKALAAIKELMKEANTRGHGGSWEGGKQKEKWFSWVDTKEVLGAKDLEEALAGWGFETDFDEGGNINSLFFNGEKMGQEDEMLMVIAPFIRKGSYLDFSGEDGDHWRFAFDGKVLKRQKGKVVFD